MNYIETVRIDHNKWKKKMMKRVSIINKVNGNIIGTVLNGADNSKDKYYYYYGDEDSRTGRRAKRH